MRSSCCIVFVCLLAAQSISADDVQEPAAAGSLDECIDLAATFLLTRQHPAGFFNDKQVRMDGDLETWQKKFRAMEIHPPRHSTAFTSLAIMGLASLGHQPGDATAEGNAMSRALNYVLEDRLTDEQGYYGRSDHSRMYGHGITTLMLTEMVGMGQSDRQDRLLRQRCEAALNLILSAQKLDKSPIHRGGWRYNPDSKDSDLSVTVWQLMALRSARNAGFTVPKHAIDDAIAYLRVCYNSERDQNGRPINLRTGFCYHKGRNPEFATTAAGLLALQVCGAYDMPEVEASSQYLLTSRMTPVEDVNWLYYGIYYYAQGMSQRGGETASRAKKITESLLLRLQKNNGAFQGQGEERSEVYSTAMALLSLSIQHHYLPIYQR